MRKLFCLFLVIVVLIGTIGCKSNYSNSQSEPILIIDDELSTGSENVYNTTSNTSSSSSSIHSSTNSTTTSTTISSESVTGSVENNSKGDEYVEYTEELLGVNKLRPDYNLNDCRDLQGDITVVVFYMDDFESNWTPEEITHFTEKEIKPGLKFLEDSARKFNIGLRLNIKEIHSSIYYRNEVNVDVKESGYATGDVLYTAAKHLGYKNDSDLISDYKRKYSTEVICYCIFNQEGTSYALNPKRGTNIEISEHVLMFAYDMDSTGFEPEGWQSSIIAHETLHLYGAEDYYNPTERKVLAKRYYSNDIMLSCEYYLSLNDLGDATAFYIGWTVDVPPVIYEEGWKN